MNVEPLAQIAHIGFDRATVDNVAFAGGQQALFSPERVRDGVNACPPPDALFRCKRLHMNGYAVVGPLDGDADGGSKLSKAWDVFECCSEFGGNKQRDDTRRQRRRRA